MHASKLPELGSFTQFIFQIWYKLQTNLLEDMFKKIDIMMLGNVEPSLHALHT
jgi:hypothetical protein